ncbi:MAG: M23 family metallopeptidase [Clostridiales bacterium]|nr:M23 family metallopeptidase [Clostridiales bacterium]
MEENEKNLLETTGFVSRELGAGRTRFPRALDTRAVKSVKSGAKKRDHGSWYLLLRLGVCAFLFFGVLGIKLKGSEGVTERGTDETGRESGGAEDTIGRLKFVELPSIIEVFAPSKRAILPAEPVSFDFSEEDGRLVIVTEAGADIVSPTDGVIRAVGEDETLGRYVTVASDGDVEFTVYGLFEVCVERGQPVKQRAKLGVSREGSVTVMAYQSGRPLDLAAVFDLGKAG